MKFLNFPTPENFDVVALKFEHPCRVNHWVMCAKDVDGMANSVDLFILIL